MAIRRVLTLIALTVLCLSAIRVREVAADDWRPIDPAHLALKAPVVEKDADAEAIFWEVRVNDAGEDLIFSHYIRIKVFTERGKESQSKIDIPYYGRNRIVDIAARTIKPDGTIVELKKDAIFDRTIIKAGEFKVKAKSFAMPSVEPGVIIDYRWREVRPNQYANNVRLQFQRDIPVQSVKYYLKPMTSEGFSTTSMSAQAFNGTISNPVRDKEGFYTTSMTNVPALHEEPRMPPEDQVRTWMLLYYTKDKPQPPDVYWPSLGKILYESLKSTMKANDEVKKAAATAIGDASTPEQKLERLYNFCHTQIKNINNVASGLTEADREKFKKNNSPADTLKRGMGDDADIDQLFGAMASSVGFDVRTAVVSDRGDIFFDKSFAHYYFLRNAVVAVRVGKDWKFFDPGTPYLPYGMIRWQSEAILALICDSKEAGFVQTPVSPSSKSVQKRNGAFKLNEDGTLEGDVRIEYTGFLAMDKKNQNDDDSPSQREETLRDTIKRQLSTAELSNIKIENVTDPDKPFVYSFHVRVPGYAQRTGKRLFVQPGFFQRGVGALFPSSNRTHSIYFHYLWREEDSVTIALPKGFDLDNADAPGPIKAGDVADYKIWIGVTKDHEELQFKRNFNFDALVFPVSSYSQLKALFDRIHEEDNHTITLKQSVATQ